MGFGLGSLRSDPQKVGTWLRDDCGLPYTSPQRHEDFLLTGVEPSVILPFFGDCRVPFRISPGVEERIPRNAGVLIPRIGFCSILYEAPVVAPHL